MTWEEQEGLYLVWQHSIGSEHSVAEKFYYIVKVIFHTGLIIVRVAKEEVDISPVHIVSPILDD